MAKPEAHLNLAKRRSLLLPVTVTLSAGWSRTTILNLCVTTIRSCISNGLRNWDTKLQSWRSNENNLWLGVPESIRSKCFPMAVIHGLRTAGLEDVDVRPNSSSTYLIHLELSLGLFIINGGLAWQSWAENLILPNVMDSQALWICHLCYFCFSLRKASMAIRRPGFRCTAPFMRGWIYPVHWALVAIPLSNEETLAQTY